MFKVGSKVTGFFPVGAQVLCRIGYGDMFIEGELYEVVDPSEYMSGAADPDTYAYIRTEHGRVAGMYPDRFKLVEPPTSRANDPATSKGKRRVNKYEQAVLSYLSCNSDGIGKEIAAGMRMPLNCITPRFASLRRKGLIKALEVPIELGENRICPKYVKRDKQIVWVLA